MLIWISENCPIVRAIRWAARIDPKFTLDPLGQKIQVDDDTPLMQAALQAEKLRMHLVIRGDYPSGYALEAAEHDPA